ncbi:MAG: nickel-dependent lactate racemase [Planctomycetes bacterium]|nr:nickel-dependent lactate racemase [Planctomycetota bacterium]
MQVHLAYGRTGLQVELPSANVVKCLGYQPAEPVDDPLRAVRRSLESPIGTPPLAQLARGCRNACVAICDVTRPVPNAQLLAPLLATLEAAGIPRSEILVLIATGLHRPNEGDELAEMVGPKIAADYRIENHRGENLSEHVFLGDSPRGVPIWIDRRYVEAELKITTGLIEPHFMAGFSGGRKLICPGLAALETIRVWHGPDFLEHPAARAGVLDGNPVHEENSWIARHVGCDFIVNTVLDDQRRILDVVAGHMDRAFAQGVDFVRKLTTDTISEPADIVVTSSAGYPLDTTFYQSVKGMVTASAIVKPGGTIILAAGMSLGIGSEDFQRLFDENPTLDGFMQRITETDYFVPDQWQLEELAQVRRKARVVAVTDGLPPERLARLFVEPAPTVESAISDALSRHGPAATIAVIPKGPYVIAEVA